MFPAAHPDIMGQLARERVAELRADAERHRRGRPFLASWRKARFVEPAADLSRVLPPAAPEAAEAAEAGRAPRAAPPPAATLIPDPRPGGSVIRGW
ncbi:MAG: hypothetical protein ACJ74K_16820 [Actinomycetes bacterium]